MAEERPQGTRKAFVLGCLAGGVLTIVLLVTIFVGGGLLFRGAFVKKLQADLKPPRMQTGTAASYDWKVKTAAGAPFDIASTKGKAVFLNFWSPDCTHCESELSSIENLYRQTYGSGVEFMCVAVDNGDKVPELIAKYNLTVPIYVLEGKRPPVYDSESAPLTFIITPSGDISLRIAGSAKWDDPSAIATLKLLATGADPK